MQQCIVLLITPQYDTPIRHASGVGALLLSSIMHPASDQAERIYHLANYFSLAAGFILVVVTTLTVVFTYRFRQRDDDEEPKTLKRDHRIEALMIGVPMLLVIVFFYLTVTAMRSIAPPSGDSSPEVIVTGHQWWWGAYYPKQRVHAANEIHLPVGKKILIDMRSADVIHSWWVPELGNKIDLIPGRINHLWLTIRQAGTYEGACSEFCGAGHAWMRIKVIAQDSADYANWLATNQQPAQQVSGNIAMKGEQVFESKTCGNCHRIKGTDADGTTGPDLTHLASRTTLLAGRMPNNRNNLEEWLKDPQYVKPGAHMPNFRFDDTTLNELVTYLSTLK